MCVRSYPQRKACRNRSFSCKCHIYKCHNLHRHFSQPSLSHHARHSFFLLGTRRFILVYIPVIKSLPSRDLILFLTASLQELSSIANTLRSSVEIKSMFIFLKAFAMTEVSEYLVQVLICARMISSLKQSICFPQAHSKWSSFLIMNDRFIDFFGVFLFRLENQIRFICELLI